VSATAHGQADPADCPGCGRDSCDGTCSAGSDWPAAPLGPRQPRTAAEFRQAAWAAEGQTSATSPLGFDAARVVPASVLVEEGRRLQREGVPYVVDGLVPDFGVAGFLVGYAKVGKSTVGVSLAGAVARGAAFLGRATRLKRVLALHVEDPREYTAWLMARTLNGEENLMVYPAPLVLSEESLSALERFIPQAGVGLVYVASFLAAVRGLVRDENDNAGMSAVVESIKQCARRARVPFLVEAHAGRGEDQAADADPVRALRGASAAAAAADFVLSLKRDGRGGFGTRRVLSGAGRFVSVPPLAFDYDAPTGALHYLGERDGSAAVETDWRLIQETGALGNEWRSVSAIARAAGLSEKAGSRARVRRALQGRAGVAEQSRTRRDGVRAQEFRTEGETP
jgi:hypothetical protein